jgi:hypothetical protein
MSYFINAVLSLCEAVHCRVRSGNYGVSGSGGREARRESAEKEEDFLTVSQFDFRLHV